MVILTPRARAYLINLVLQGGGEIYWKGNSRSIVELMGEGLVEIKIFPAFPGESYVSVTPKGNREVNASADTPGEES